MRIGSADLAITAVQASRTATATATPSPKKGDPAARPEGAAPPVPPAVGYTQSPLSADTITAVQGQNRTDGKPPSDQDETGSDGLTPEEEAIVDDLQQRDAEVRRHEQAHAAVGGQYAGAPSYEYERGPDGQFYAVGGEVSIDTSAIPGDPEATIAKMQQVRRAALAPAQPSAQDRRVATEAQQALVEARAELAQAESDEGSPAASVEPERTAPDDSASRSLAAARAFQQTTAR
ncbi:hypothetical protein HH303_14635 [Rhodospirillaceae bacterium KN72]|uniref:SprA-related family protein n=1 Tax=Pacificispira spongiicola TaxID=2729598 RepID=A0A7Y0E1X4_9PROT|nr:putative metalloprotease CJM1_0395 family protein [Pacificispira spongiicola]NMM45730.1 hypothetical protein [Pacificispira spongiicola]